MTWFRLRALVALFFAVGQIQCDLQNALQTYCDWNVVDFVWASAKERKAAIKNGTYDPLSVAIFDVEVFYRSQDAKSSCDKADTIIVVTTPRLKCSGIPAVLSTIKLCDGPHNPRLEPFPSFEFNRQGNCDGLSNVYRTDTDACNRLWVLDTGNIGGLYDVYPPIDACPPKVVIFDDLTKGGALVGMYPIPKSVLRCNSILLAIATDRVTANDSCDGVYAYISDSNNPAIIVFNLAENSFYRIIANSFFPDFGYFSVSGTAYQTMSGILLRSRNGIVDGDRTVFYHAFSSLKQNSVQASILRDQAAFEANLRALPDAFRTFAKEMESPSSVDCMNSDGLMFFSLLNLNAIACWNSASDPNYTITPIIAQNEETIQLIEGMKVYNYQLFIVSTQLQKYFFNNVTADEINYRLLFGCSTQLINGTACQSLSCS